MVFGSRSVLFGVLLIKTLPSKYISQIRLGKYNLKKKLQRKDRWRRQRKKKKRKKIFNGWQKKRETYAQGEACSSTKMRGMKELALRRAKRWDERNEGTVRLWRHEHLKGNLVIANSPPMDTPKCPRTFLKMDLMRSILGMRVQSIIIKRNFWPKVTFCNNQTQFLGQLFAKRNFWTPKVEKTGTLFGFGKDFFAFIIYLFIWF